MKQCDLFKCGVCFCVSECAYMFVRADVYLNTLFVCDLYKYGYFSFYT